MQGLPAHGHLNRNVITNQTGSKNQARYSSQVKEKMYAVQDQRIADVSLHLNEKLQQLSKKRAKIADNDNKYGLDQRDLGRILINKSELLPNGIGSQGVTLHT